MKWDGKLYDKSHSFVSAYGAEVLDMLGDIRGKSVLDAGCGTGLMTVELARSGARVVGVELLKDIFSAYLGAQYNPKYDPRIAMIADIERAGE